MDGRNAGEDSGGKLSDPVGYSGRVLEAHVFAARVIDLPFYFRCPQVLAIDSADVRVKVADAKSRGTEQIFEDPYSVIEPLAVKPHPSTYCRVILNGRRLRY